MPAVCVLEPRVISIPIPANGGDAPQIPIPAYEGDAPQSYPWYTKHDPEDLPPANIQKEANILVLDAESGREFGSDGPRGNIVAYLKKGNTYANKAYVYDKEHDANKRATFQLYHRLNDVYTFYLECFGRRGLDGRNGYIIAWAMWGTQNNALWQGRDRPTHLPPEFEGNDAYTRKGFMAFGTPSKSDYQMNWSLALDIVGHEATHGVVHATTRLEYQDESGALDESLADCFGIMMKHWKLDQRDPAKAEWELGAGVEYPFKFGIRNFQEPGDYDQPKHMDNYRRLDDDNGGVHTNSGIPNHAFYLAVTAVGGPSWDIIGKIWYDTMIDEENLPPDATFLMFANRTVHHSPEMYRSIVRNAWNSVGIVTE